MRKICGKQWRAETPINGEDLTVNFYIEIWEPNKNFFNSVSRLWERMKVKMRECYAVDPISENKVNN